MMALLPEIALLPGNNIRIGWMKSWLEIIR